MDMQRAIAISHKIQLAQVERDDLDEYIENMKAALADELGGEAVEPYTIGDNEHGFELVTVRKGATFNEGYLKKQNPDAWKKAAITKETVTSDSAKAVLSEDEYAQGQKPHTKTTIKIERLSDE